MMEKNICRGLVYWTVSRIYVCYPSVCGHFV